MNRIQELENLIKKASAAYYDGDEPIMEDSEFDALVEELKELDPTNSILTKVGFDSDKVSHANDTKIPIEIRVSLPKYKFQNQEGIKNWLEKGEEVAYYISPKLDGMSVIITYENKTLKSMISRGNGEYGMDLTSRFLPLIQSGNFDIPYHSVQDGTVRGELFIKKSVFDEILSEDYANPRNATSGIVNSDSIDNKQYLSFLQHPQFKWIGLPIAETHPLCDFKEIELRYDIWNRSSDIPIDGIVIDKVIQGVLVDSIAVKFPTESVETTVKNISWQLSPRNRWIPVVEFEPVQLYGTEVERATGLHYNYIITHKIGKGAVIKVTKANEIIPQITSVVKPVDSLDEINLPEEFKVVGLHAVKPLETIEDWFQHFSKNFLFRSLSTRGISNTTIKKFLDEFEINDIIDYKNFRNKIQESNEFSKNMIQDKLGRVTGELLYNQLTTFTIEERNLLRYVGFDGVGSVATEKLRNNFDYQTYLTTDEDVVDRVPVNSNVKELLRNFNARRALQNIWSLLTFHKILVEDKYEENPVKNTNTKVCLSGKFPGFTKAQLIEKFADKWNLVDSLDKDCKYLVVPTLDRVSSKVTKAQKWGIEIIDFNKFLTL